jgi:NADPH2:quinone reductase
VRAVVVDPARDDLSVSEVPDPVASEGQLLVRVRGAGLNRADLLVRRGAYRVGPRGDRPVAPFVAGGELAGEVDAVGPGVEGWRAGDRLMARGAGYAELAAVDARMAIAVPDGIGWEEAGGLMVALITMHDALVTNGRLRAGDAVVVNAATSGVGVVGVRLAALLGAGVVFATSRSAHKLDVLQAFLGPLPCPLIPVDTSQAELPAVVADHTGGVGADVIVDNVGAAALADNVAAAAIRGRIVQVGRLGGRTAEIDLDELARKRIALVGVTFRTRGTDEVVAVVDAARRDVGQSLDRVVPRVDRVFPLDQAAEAQDQLARDEHVGKLVLVPGR